MEGRIPRLEPFSADALFDVEEAMTVPVVAERDLVMLGRAVDRAVDSSPWDVAIGFPTGTASFSEFDRTKAGLDICSMRWGGGLVRSNGWAKVGTSVKRRDAVEWSRSVVEVVAVLILLEGIKGLVEEGRESPWARANEVLVGLGDIGEVTAVVGLLCSLDKR